MMKRVAPASGTRLNLITNWFEELRQLYEVPGT